MNFYTELVVVEQQDAIKIEECLCGDREFHDPITYTAKFSDRRFMDITLYPGDFIEDADWIDDEDRSPYVACALFEEDEFFSLASDEPYECFLTFFELQYEDNIYKAIVISENHWMLDEGVHIKYMDNGRLLVIKPDGTQITMY